MDGYAGEVQSMWGQVEGRSVGHDRQGVMVGHIGCGGQGVWDTTGKVHGT